MFRLVIVLTLIALAFGGASRPSINIPKLGGRIVGGKDTNIQNHPYQVSFQVLGEHSCGGSLIARNVVVTAAHCTEDLSAYIKYLTVRVGATIHDRGGSVVNVASIHDHPKYDPDNSNDYDVSVLVLKQSVTLGATVGLIPLQSVNQEVSTGTLATVTGWGVLEFEGFPPNILQEVQVPKVEQSTCVKNYPKENISARMHCFGYAQGGKDACQGDSGGPLVANGRLVGVVSWGYDCAAANLAGVYAKVANKEIQDHINSVVARFQ